MKFYAVHIQIRQGIRSAVPCYSRYVVPLATDDGITTQRSVLWVVCTIIFAL